MKKGKQLTYGDTIAVVAPASPGSKKEVESAKKGLEHLGFHIKIGKSCFTSYGGYLAGTNEARALEINEMFADPKVDAIMCLRGGYGTPHLLNLLDYSMINANPKLFIGYSDVTALHIAMNQRSNLVTIHGPMAVSCTSSMNAFSKKCLLKILVEKKQFRKIQNPPSEEIKCLVKGQANGTMIGGNLSLISATMGTPFEINTKGKILFLEDVCEEPYRIDRMLTQLSLAGKFHDAVGIILGSWTACESIKYPKGFSIEDLFKKIISPYNKPTIWNLKAGHDKWNIALPFGVDAWLDATKGELMVDNS